MRNTVIHGIKQAGSRAVRRLLARAFGALLAAAALPALGAGACSTAIGLASLNEYNHQDNFVEVKRLNAGAAMTNWKVRLYSGAGTYTQRNFPVQPSDACGEYYVFNFGTSPKDADIVLLDGNDDVIDLLRVRTASMPIATAFYAPYPSCGFLSPPTDLQIDASRKGVDRSPDGVGPWRNTPGVGANSYQTRCGGNTPGGAATDLRISKTAGAASILLGANVSFTVTVSNLGGNVASTLIISDILPAGLDYVSHAVTAGTFTPATGLWALGSLAVGASQTLTLTARGTSVGTWTNTASVSSDNADPNTANNNASAAVTVTGSVTPGSFNAFETATAAGATSGVIKTKVAGSPFSLDVVAISSGAQAGTFDQTIRVELLGNTATGIALDGNNCPVSATLLQTVAPSPALAGGRATVSFAAVGDAWKDVRVRIGYPAASPTVVSCSTDNFAIRPAELALVNATDSDWQTPGTGRPLANTGATGGNVHKAGRPFTLRATARNATGAVTGNYAGSPMPKSLACTLPTPTCVSGVLTPGAWSGNGTVTASSASYSEAGAFNLTLEDQAFADVDSADSTLLERTVPQDVAVSVGRFVPDHFELTESSTPTFVTFNDATCGSRAFTYVGQPFGYLTVPQATITAKNAAGATTLNYTGVLWKLAASGVTQNYVAATGTLDTGLVGTPVVNAGSSGAGTLSVNAADVVAFVRSTPVAPFVAEISLSMSIQDSSENAVTGNGLIDTVTPALFSNIAFDSGNAIRFGRLALTNAHGSELLGLPVPVETQFWNGSSFVRNTADDCTRLTASQVALSNWRRDLNACETSVSLSGRFVDGRGNLRFSAPGAGNTGSVDLSIQLGASGSGSSCVGGAVTTATGAAQTWLQGRWAGGAYDQNPAARASFGLYRGGRSLIYLREMY